MGIFPVQLERCVYTVTLCSVHMFALFASYSVAFHYFNRAHTHSQHTFVVFFQIKEEIIEEKKNINFFLFPFVCNIRTQTHARSIPMNGYAMRDVMRVHACKICDRIHHTLPSLKPIINWSKRRSSAWVHLQPQDNETRRETRDESDIILTRKVF